VGAYSEAGGDVGDGAVVDVALQEDVAVVVGEVGQGGAEHGDVGVAFGVQLCSGDGWGQAVEGVVLDRVGAAGFAGHADGFVDCCASPVGCWFLDGAAGGHDPDHLFQGSAGGFLGVDAGYACCYRTHDVGAVHDPVIDP
jgi:hypothetical protein